MNGGVCEEGFAVAQEGSQQPVTHLKNWAECHRDRLSVDFILLLLKIYIIKTYEESAV